MAGVRRKKDPEARSEVTKMSEVTAVMNDLRTVIFDALTWQDKVAAKAGITLPSPGTREGETDARRDA